MDGNINHIIPKTTNINTYLLRQTTSNTQLGIFFDVPLPSELFGKTTSGKDKIFILLTNKSISPTLPSNLVQKKLSNLLFRSSSNYSKLTKGKPKTALIFQALRELNYIKN